MKWWLAKFWPFRAHAEGVAMLLCLVRQGEVREAKGRWCSTVLYDVE